MDDRNHIPMLSKAERETSIQAILDKSLPSSRPCWWNLSLSTLVFGIEDCLFLAILLGLFPLAFAFTPAEILAEQLAAILFFASPPLYVAAYALTMWKESLCGTLDWKRTCRLSLQTLMALRMLLFGGIALLVCVPVNLLLWQVSGHAIPLSRALAISFSSLFLHAALSLICQKWQRGIVVPIAAWILFGMATLVYQPWNDLLPEIPTTIFFMLAAAGLTCCLAYLRTILCTPNKGGSIYAFH